MPYTPIAPLPAVPDASDGPETFTDDVDTFLGALPTWAEQVNAAGEYIDDTVVDIDASAAAAAASALAASGSATNAAGSASAAEISKDLAQASADFKGAWSALSGALNRPATVSHNGSYWALLNNLANVTLSTPSVTNADWLFVSGTRWQAVRTASFTAAANAYWPILATGSAVDATLPAMSAGSFICIYNQTGSTQTVRIINAGYTIKSRNSTITSADNIILQAGQMAYLLCINSTNLEVIANG